MDKGSHVSLKFHIKLKSVNVGAGNKTVGLELTWAHNLFVEWASRFSTLGRSRHRNSK